MISSVFQGDHTDFPLTECTLVMRVCQDYIVNRQDTDTAGYIVIHIKTVKTKPFHLIFANKEILMLGSKPY